MARTKKTEIPKEHLDALRFSGIMGHPFCYLTFRDGSWWVSGETNTLTQCLKHSNPDDLIFERKPRGYVARGKVSDYAQAV